MYNRYHGNSGRVDRVSEQDRYTQNRRPSAPAQMKRPPSPASGLSGALGGLMRRLSNGLETEDLLLALLLYLLYRDSGDEEFLFAIAALLLL